jgi:carbamoylphosphate synthase large subunit
MTRVWFNKTFSHIHGAMLAIREGDAEGRYHLVHSSSNPFTVAKLACDTWIDEPQGITGDKYLQWCVVFCQENAIDIFVPGKEATLLSSHYNDFAAIGTRMLLAASADTLSLLHDKSRFSRDTQCLEIPSVEFMTFTDLATFDAAYSVLKQRYSILCMKPAQSVYGIGFKKILEATPAMKILMSGDEHSIDLPSLRAALSESSPGKGMLLMPYLSGPEFSVDCVAVKGEMLIAVARKKSNNVAGGQSIDNCENIQASCRTLIDRFELNGNINIQYRAGEEGLRLLEINPRMSGGIGMASLAGANLPYLALAAFDQGVQAISIPAIKHGLVVGEINRAVVLYE